MWSIVILVLLTEQFHPSCSLETVQAALSSIVELPCATASQPNESRSSAKIVWIRDDQADIVSLDTVITVRDPRLSIIPADSNERQERVLRLANVEEHDHGLYRCVQGDVTLNEVLLDVLIPPRIVSHTPEQMHLTVREGRDAEFSCIATGHPTPRIIWHVNGLSRPGIVATVEGRNESILILRNVSRLDSGRIDCSASNALSTVNRQFLLDVKYKPMVTIPSHPSHFRLYDSATITCQACSIPPPTIFDVFRPRKAVPISKGLKEKFGEFVNQTCRQLTFTLYFSHPSVFGAYVCRARNAVGVSHAEFVLREINQSMRQMKSTTERRPLSALVLSSTGSTLISTNESASPKRNGPSTSNSHAHKNRSTTLSASIVLLAILFARIL